MQVREFQKEIELTNLQITKILLSVFYTVGGIVAFTPYNQLLLPFSPFLLFTSFLCLFYFEEVKSKGVIGWFIFVYISSFLIEWYGVHTGILFGDYVYLNNLGLKLDGVPLVIPINWLVLAVAGSELINKYVSKWNKIISSFTGGGVVVILDVFIEMVCEPLGFWKWSQGMPPMINYISWWVFMSIFIYIRIKFFPSRNPLSIYLYLTFFGYFILQVIANF
ncbi:carotenoid biosynthesis protein [Flammeovirga pectinis]|uniref:Carotenoid biosynthesis protein n=1 Tax=Flammeovirga pectinis TaxID=2494373 RepID=A0A3Q9FPD1_9BACT|nr:carotenoid biosynthesis protein [Flammeovirga pectinis]AZQ61600.1 carotenoid biosynthesis protein [Flammeovirga pectinis]